MAALKRRLPCLKSVVQLQQLLQRQRFSHSAAAAAVEATRSELGPKPEPMPATSPSGPVDTWYWRKLDSRSLGITLSMIPDSSRILLRILQNEGFDAYLVGGCVRDLLLNKVPKDFDVITTATLAEIKKKFHRAYIVGRKFPICRVHIRGSAIEVSSFETLGKGATHKEDVHPTDIPKPYDAKDFLRWRNSLHRDFTINSLFYDPFAQRIYDYSDGMTDLTAMKLRTLLPAHLSFEEDCARILRGVRIAARLGFTFANDTEKAIRSLYASIMTLDKARLMMELNYMLSYGAAERSLLLLKRFNILELLLPLHAAYLAEHSNKQTPAMMMKLFFNLDKVTSCDQPCNSGLWVSLLAFHLALVNNPQDAIVVWTLSSLLYHGNWKEGVTAARELSVKNVDFMPEILKSSNDVTDEDLAQRVANFASLVLDSVDMLTDSESLRIAMNSYPSSPSSGLVLISKNAGKEVSAIFKVLLDDIESLREERHYYSIDYNLLGKGDMVETRFALGKIIMDTMKSGEMYGKLAAEKGNDLRKVVELQVDDLSSSISRIETQKFKGGPKRGRGVLNDHKDQLIVKKLKKKQTTDLEQKFVKEKLREILSCKELAQKRQQLKKGVVKDVKKLLSLQKVPLKNIQVELEKHCEAQTPKEILSVLGKVSSPGSQGSKEIVDVLGKVTRTGKQQTGHAPEKVLSVLGQVPQVKIQRKEQLPKDVVNAFSLSDIFKGDKCTAHKDNREEKETRVGVGSRDERTGMKRARKLSSIFK